MDPFFRSGTTAKPAPSCFKTKELNRHFQTSPPKKEKPCKKAQQDAFADLLLLREKLREEGRVDLLAQVAVCGQPLKLRCMTCGQGIEVAQRCKKKWCPSCARSLAAARAEELNYIVERFRWPLFVTLTMKNVGELHSGDIKKLMKAFSKLRHRRFWKARVKGGVVKIEITNIGNGWHPHLHLVVDCVWLSDGNRPPSKPFTQAEMNEAKLKSAQEVERHWSKCLGQKTSSVDIMRANRKTIAKEVLKYTVKVEDLLDAEGEAGTIIDALAKCRELRTFGIAHGQKTADIRTQAKEAIKRRRKESLLDRPPRCPCGDEMFAPEDVYDFREARDKKYAH